MSFLEFNFYFISGMMVGVELLHGEDYTEDSGVKWGIVFDLFILRITVMVRSFP